MKQDLAYYDKDVARLKFKRRQPALPSPSPLSSSLLSPSLYQLGVWGSAVSSPVGSGAKPRR